MTIADDQLARIGSALDDWDGQDAALPARARLPDLAEAAYALEEALQPIIPIVIKLGVGVGPMPGSDSEDDATWGASVALVLATVTASVKGDVPLHQQIALRSVEDPEGPFNGELMSVLTGEGWLICARQLEDGTLLPLDGMRRHTVASS